MINISSLKENSNITLGLLSCGHVKVNKTTYFLYLNKIREDIYMKFSCYFIEILKCLI
jgi:hypothetical protein